MIWEIQQGEVHPRLDSWGEFSDLQEPLTLDPNQKIKDYWNEGEWDERMMLDAGLTREQREYLRKLVIVESEPDLLRLKLSSTGVFTSSSAWDII